MESERERQLRRKFGPPAAGPSPPPDPTLRRRRSTRRDRLVLSVACIGLVLAASLAALALVTPPPAHVAPGCSWWTATPADRITAGERGCFRGYYVGGGGLADSAHDPAIALHMDLAGSTCVMSPGDAAVVKGEAVFGEGRITILVDACR